MGSNHARAVGSLVWRGLATRSSCRTAPAIRHELLRVTSPITCVGKQGRESTSRKPGRDARHFHLSAAARWPPAAPKSRDRGPKSTEETQTDFTAMDIMSQMPVPSTAVDACMDDGFALDSGLKVTGAGLLLLSGEAFKWRPWIRDGGEANAAGAIRGGEGGGRGRLQNGKGQFDVDEQAWGVLSLVWPKPDLLIIGTGARMIPISSETRRQVNGLGIRIEVQDTRNAAAQFNLLATERGVQQVAAALVPIGWREGN